MPPPSRPSPPSKRRPASRRRTGEAAPSRGIVTASERAEIVRGRWSKPRGGKPGGPEATARSKTPAKTKSGHPAPKVKYTGPAKAPRPARGGNRPQRPARTEATADADRGAPAGPMRIAKAMARAGLCSRRDAERWIADGRVAVNGRPISSPALDVTPADRIVVDGEPLPEAEPIRLWRYYKPRGLVTTHRDPEGRPTVFDALPSEMPRVISIGRLDFNTEGLLLLTTDGALARHLELPSTGWLRRYRVRAWGKVTQAELDTLKGGIEIEGIAYGPVEAMLDKIQGDNSWLTIALREGKNREVRKILLTLGLDVNRLIRVSFGPFQLQDLEPGGIEIVRRRVMIEQLGPVLARDLGLYGDDEPAKPRGVAPKSASRPARRPGREPET